MSVVEIFAEDTVFCSRAFPIEFLPETLTLGDRKISSFPIELFPEALASGDRKMISSSSEEKLVSFNAGLDISSCCDDPLLIDFDIGDCAWSSPGTPITSS